MYLGIDVGGTKTLVAIFSKAGQIEKETKFETAKDYNQFLVDSRQALEQLNLTGIKATCCAIPGRLDRKNGIGIRFGNLPWANVPLLIDLKKIGSLGYIYLENDAKLGGLYEANAYDGMYRRLLYIPIGTGIGIALIVDGRIDFSKDDSGGNSVSIEYEGADQPWEGLASGKAIVKKYGKKASEIDDPEIWQQYSESLAAGLGKVISDNQPDAVVIGGGVGAHLEKFEPYLQAELAKKLDNVPPIIKAKRPEEAVIYGCYEYIKQNS